MGELEQEACTPARIRSEFAVAVILTEYVGYQWISFMPAIFIHSTFPAPGHGEGGPTEVS